MPQRQYTTEYETVTRYPKRITLPWEMEAYQEIVKDPARFRAAVDEQWARYPQLFPTTMGEGYTLHDSRTSRKLGVQLRRIKLRVAPEGSSGVYTIMPSAVLPYMTGYTDEVEKALYLRRYGVSFEGLSYVFGRDAQYWYRICGQLGQLDLVGTMIQDESQLPVHLVADEKHVTFHGERAYLATTVGEECVLGVSLTLQADRESLTRAYGVFAQEARQVDPTYEPETVNTDGWQATRSAWLTLFPAIVLLRCFLHSWLKIRERLQRTPSLLHEVGQQVWDAYHAPDAATFTEAIETLEQWATEQLTGPVQKLVHKLTTRVDEFARAYEFPQAARTSNMVDRHIRALGRWFDSQQDFHGHWRSAEQQARAWALIHNFTPYGTRAAASDHFISPAHRLTGYVYHDNWLHNLLVSASAARAGP